MSMLSVKSVTINAEGLKVKAYDEDRNQKPPFSLNGCIKQSKYFFKRRNGDSIILWFHCGDYLKISLNDLVELEAMEEIDCENRFLISHLFYVHILMKKKWIIANKEAIDQNSYKLETLAKIFDVKYIFATKESTFVRAMERDGYDAYKYITKRQLPFIAIENI